ncbi:hypothetical protein A2973_02345 [Candidatus Gottesmanbacteria bacterium RIFCSPLOWO2_01_FULL_49_10]|uniref:Uncharacterized protein n=1 Tax=Candidatus Gottesmanbacteria bacterium RIFCSPLOWO2_01_FULL_49_10 TaxID=1798396 RepID=A0A1F6AXT4_9BACT|nr:MAG: hypothetical protein A2973_02345 [Candidatus Gottesmanbacteria bacterium RIFCSPLOWO2_01_FULL_49_10]
MAKRASGKAGIAFLRDDLASWNFIIFLTLALILLVVILSAMKNVTLDLRSRAGLACPSVDIQKISCTGKIVGRRDTNGCIAFTCENE